jgi:DNA-binding response OmpR family regulator
MNILVVEDREDIASLIKLYLEKESYKVTVAGDGLSALGLIKNNTYHLCVFDIMLPKLDGYLLLKEVRAFSTVPVIMLTAKVEEHNKILGLDLGADDYMTKPFSPLELVSRVKALLRRNYRYNEEDKRYIHFGQWSIDQKECVVRNDNRVCTLTTSEYKLLLQLMSEPGRVFSKHLLYELISGEFSVTDDNSVTVHISRLRDKLDDRNKTDYIKTIRGLGYKIEQN